MVDIGKTTPRLWNLGRAWREIYQMLGGFIDEWRTESAKQADEIAKTIGEVRSDFSRQSSEFSKAIAELRTESAMHAAELANAFNVSLAETAKRDADLAVTGEIRSSLIRQLIATSSAQSNIQKTNTAITDDSAAVQLRKRHLDLIENILIGVVASDPPLSVHGQTEFDENVRLRGLDWPKTAFSMVGAARMHNFRVLVEQAIIGGIPGDVVETGVWRGGASMMAKAVIAAYGDSTRCVYLADSFAGLPAPDPDKYPDDKGLDLHLYEELAVSEEEVRANFAKMGLLDDRVITVKGWFRDTMQNFPAKTIAVLRLDGDLYESTIDPLKYLYDRVSPGGWVIVDDYECFDACKRATQDFLSSRNLRPTIQHIDGVGVFFQKDL